MHTHATESNPCALQHFELTAEPVPAEVLGGESFEVWALRLSGGPVREVLTTDPAYVDTREYVFAVPLDVMGNLARKLTEVYERQRDATLWEARLWAGPVFRNDPDARLPLVTVAQRLLFRA